MFGVIGLLIVVTAYSALNLENRSDVSLGVHTFRGVPVFLTSLIALILGALLIVPWTLRRGVRRRAAVPGDDVEAAAEPVADADPDPVLPDATPEPEPEPEPPGGGEPESAPRRRRRWPFGRRERDAAPDDDRSDRRDHRDGRDGRNAGGGG